MEDLPLSNMTIKSSIRDYHIYFYESLYEPLNAEIRIDDFILIDRKVFKFFNGDTKELISKNNHIFIDANEDQKSYTSLTPIIENLIKNQFRRNNRLLAIGGGITQDITAFIASMIYRGVDWLFIPTTLLAQADSCIGGKTSINIGEYKNQLGNFYPPSKIFIIPSLVKTLPKKDLMSGMGEMLHFFLVSGEDDFLFYQNNYEEALENNEVLMSLVKRNLEIKKGFIERDEFDKGERLLLNYGHSFGHTIESLTDYNIPHGIAVSYGMDIANYISLKLDFIDDYTYERIHDQLASIWKEIPLGKINIKKFESVLSQDKKNIGNTYQVILTKGIGKMLKYGIKPNDDFTSWLKEYFLKKAL